MLMCVSFLQILKYVYKIFPVDNVNKLKSDCISMVLQPLVAETPSLLRL